MSCTIGGVSHATYQAPIRQSAPVSRPSAPDPAPVANHSGGLDVLA
jgi:hypothetical protein